MAVLEALLKWIFGTYEHLIAMAQTEEMTALTVFVGLISAGVGLSSVVLGTFRRKQSVPSVEKQTETVEVAPQESPQSVLSEQTPVEPASSQDGTPPLNVNKADQSVKEYRHYIRSRWFSVNGLIECDLDDPILDDHIGYYAVDNLSNKKFILHFWLYSAKYTKDQVFELYNQNNQLSGKATVDINSLDRYIRELRRQMTFNIPKVDLRKP